MASQLGSNRTKRPIARYWHPAVPALLVVASAYAFNLGLNTVLFRLQALLPVAPQRPIVAVPLTAVGAGALLCLTVVAMTYGLLLFVRGVSDAGGHTSGTVPAVGAGQLARATGVVVGGGVAAAVGLALLVVPGLVVLAHLPLVLVAIALEDRSIVDALETAHARVRSAPRPVAVATLLVAGALAAVAAVGVYTSLVPPAIEVGVGATATALVVLAGAYAFTSLYQTSTGQRRGL